jgi:hypothetical protein
LAIGTRCAGAIATTVLRLEMESAAPGADTGFIRIAELEAFGYGDATR